MPTTPATLLTYANLQMAAEAILSDGFTGLIPIAELTDGNNRSSVFTSTQAAQFVADWEVAAHRANTETGFSGTIFRCRVTDASRGLVAGQLVMCLRSTEFADDAARDNQATNVLEISELGWAFGQIADMERWYRELSTGTGPLAGGQSFAVTGYSLGGHLATAFNILRRDEQQSARIAGTYTFNGAGVGTVRSGVTLSSVIAQFELFRNGSALSFSTPGAAARYTDLAGRYNGSTTSLTGLNADFYAIENDSSLSATERSALIDVKLTHFRGHLTVNKEGVRDAQDQAAVPGGIQAADRRAGHGRAHAGRAIA